MQLNTKVITKWMRLSLHLPPPPSTLPPPPSTLPPLFLFMIFSSYNTILMVLQGRAKRKERKGKKVEGGRKVEEENEERLEEEKKEEEEEEEEESNGEDKEGNVQRVGGGMERREIRREWLKGGKKGRWFKGGGRKRE